MNNIKPDTLRQAQLIMLDTLVEVDKICKKYDIKYWLDFGTLLGAVRHSGFIPWDDDLDIAMRIEDYHKFCKIAPDELPKNMSLQTKETEETFPYDFAKVRNNHGLIIEKHEYNKDIKYKQDIFIDIFPMITINDNLIHKYFYKINFLVIKLFSYKYLNIGFISDIFVSIADSLHLGWDNPTSKVIRSGRMPTHKLYIDIKSIFPLQKLTFEGKEFYVPKDSDKYLKILYGDNYMTLPPEDKRHTHASSIEIYEQSK